MGNVAATEFKAKCLELMDRVAEGRETYVITKHGRPVAKLVPADLPDDRSAFGCMEDQTSFLGDLSTPLSTDAEWKALERRRSEQGTAWEREWRRHGTVSGKRTADRSPAPAKRPSTARPRRGRAR